MCLVLEQALCRAQERRWTRRVGQGGDPPEYLAWVRRVNADASAPLVLLVA